MLDSRMITISSVGDLMICDSPLYVSVGVGSKYRKTNGNLLNCCKDFFYGSDIVTGNFETVVHEPKTGGLEERQMSCDPCVIKDLKAVGFSFLNIANNHSLQHGTEGFSNTKKELLNNGIQPVGIKDELPYIITKQGLRIAVMALCIHLEWYQPDEILYENDIYRIIDLVAELRNRDSADIIMVSVHWGDEFAVYPSNAQIALAHKLVDAGVNIILGHHSHVFQGIENYKDSIIVYSLGNFISDMVPEMCRTTGIVKIFIDSFDKSISYKLVPCVIGNNSIPEKSDSIEWFKNRQDLLREAIEGKFSDDDYWSCIKKNHTIAHNSFKRYFKKNILKYNLGIAIKMVVDFVGRKLKRMIGSSTDGRVSSMDPFIYDVLKNCEERNRDRITQ